MKSHKSLRLDKRRILCLPTKFDFLDNDQTVFEEPMETLSKINELAAFEHDGFWHYGY